MSTEAIEQQPKTQEEQIIEEKVYIGNVDYNLTKEELDEFLKGFEVESTEVPKKTTRRKGEEVEVGAGYAFATFKTADEAKRAIVELNNKEFKGRKVYTRQALPESLRPKKTVVRPTKKAKEPKAKKVAGESEESAESTGDDATTAKPKSTKRREPKKRTRIAKVPLSEGIPSKDTVFINNLDFEITEDALKEAFAEFEPIWVDIPKKTVPSHVYKTLKKQNVPIRGRGIGFVRFATEDQQKQAVEKINGKEINGRVITVSIAVDSNIKPAEEKPVEEPKEVEASQ